MNDAHTADLGEEFEIAADPKPKGRAKSKIKDKPTKAPKVVPPRKGRAKAAKPLEDAELEEQQAQDVEGRNAKGIEGRENVNLAFLLDSQAHKKELGRLKMKWQTRVKKAKEDGVFIDEIKDIVKELKEDDDILADKHNVLNQLRRLVKLPAFDRVPLSNEVADDDERDEKATVAGERHFWRGGREQDNPYGDDPGSPRSQHWLRGFRDAEEFARKFSAPSTLRKLAEKPA